MLRVIHRRLPMNEMPNGSYVQDIPMDPDETLFSVWVDSTGDGREFVHVLTTVKVSPDEGGESTA